MSNTPRSVESRKVEDTTYPQDDVTTQTLSTDITANHSSRRNSLAGRHPVRNTLVAGLALISTGVSTYEIGRNIGYQDATRAVQQANQADDSNLAEANQGQSTDTDEASEIVGSSPQTALPLPSRNYQGQVPLSAPAFVQSGSRSMYLINLTSPADNVTSETLQVACDTKSGDLLVVDDVKSSRQMSASYTNYMRAHVNPVCTRGDTLGKQSLGKLIDFLGLNSPTDWPEPLAVQPQAPITPDHSTG